MKENQRTKLTKRMLKDSLIALLQAKSIHKISVRELCETADINRSTFYKYYNNQYDLFESIQQDFLMHINDSFVQEAAPDDRKSLMNAMQYIDENMDIARVLLQDIRNNDLLDELLQLPMIRAQLMGNALSESEQGQNKGAYTYDFIVNGAFSMIKSWIKKDERESPQEIADLLLDLVQCLAIRE